MRLQAPNFGGDFFEYRLFVSRAFGPFQVGVFGTQFGHLPVSSLMSSFGYLDLDRSVIVK